MSATANRKAILAADKHARLWREVCKLAEPHQLRGERVLATLRRILRSQEPKK